MYLSDPLFIGFNFLLLTLVASVTFLGALRNALYLKDNSGELASLIFFMFILICFRTRGWDVEQYYNIYYSINDSSLDLNNWIEPGYLLFNYLFRTLGFDFFVFNSVLAILISLLMYFSIKINSKFLVVSLFWFFLFYFFRGPYGQVRQAISILAFFYSLRFLTVKEKSYSKYAIINLFALSFHSIAILSLLTPFLLKFKVTRIKVLVVFFVFLVLILISGSSVGFESLLYYLDGIPYAEKLYIYVTNFAASGSILNPDVVRICLCFFVLLSLPREFYTFPDCLDIYKIQCLVFLLGAILYAIFSFDLRVASRMASYFFLIDIFIYANAFRYIRSFKGRFVYFSCVTFVGLIYVVFEFMMMRAGEIKYEWSL